MVDSVLGAIRDGVCSNKQMLVVGFAVLVVFDLMTLVSFTVVTPGTATYVVNVINLITLTTLAVVCLALMVYCFRIEPGTD